MAFPRDGCNPDAAELAGCFGHVCTGLGKASGVPDLRDFPVTLEILLHIYGWGLLVGVSSFGILRNRWWGYACELGVVWWVALLVTAHYYKNPDLSPGPFMWFLLIQLVLLSRALLKRTLERWNALKATA